MGKTTIGLALSREWFRYRYLNWDIEEDRYAILEGPRHLAEVLKIGSKEQEIPLIVFDEIHKDSRWKLFLKGLYDGYPFISQTGHSLMNRPVVQRISLRLIC